MLNPASCLQPLITYNKTKSGALRKKPVEINYGDLCGTTVVFGKSWNKPFGGIDNNTKHSLGQVIMSKYGCTSNSSRINRSSKIIIP